MASSSGEPSAALTADDSGPVSVSQPASSPWVATPVVPRSDGPWWWRVGGLFTTVRPHQWVKNVFVLAPVVFAKEIFDPPLLIRAAAAFLGFCLLAGAVYSMNDIADIASDRQHPVKRQRPIAAGRVPLAWAKLLAVGLVVVALAGAFALSVEFGLVASVYYVLNVAYSLRLKHVAYLDVGCIAAFFVMRVVGGGFATHIAISWYLLACTALLALFLGFGKRRHELAAVKPGKQRAVLESYDRRGLDLSMAITACATTAAYLAYTLNAHTRAFFRTDWLWPSTVLVVLGMWRFVYLVRARPKTESPTQEMLRDGPFVFIMLGWVGLVMWIVYQLQPRM
jgi:decaprenyl-phosphate phosphoribosyltransferase